MRRSPGTWLIVGDNVVVPRGDWSERARSGRCFGITTKGVTEDYSLGLFKVASAVQYAPILYFILLAPQF